MSIVIAEGKPLVNDRRSSSVLAVVVAYGRPLETIACWPTLCDWLARPPAKGLYLKIVVLHDNSSTPMALPAVAGPQIRYRHDASNGGTRAAFLRAADVAHAEGCSWMLLLDQDTTLPADMLAKMAQSLMANTETPAAMLPRVRHGELSVSPAIIDGFGVIRPLAPTGHPPQGAWLTAIASGSLVSVDDLRVIDPPPPALWLDGVDHWIFSQLHRRGRPVRIVETTITHELSATDLGQMPVWRVSSLLDSEAQLLAVLPTSARLIYPYRLLRQFQRIRREHPAAFRPALKWLADCLLGHQNKAFRPPQPAPPPHENSTESEVSVLLPVYNGERHLAAQLDSLLGQTHRHWICVVRDDGSKDGSPGILEKYRQLWPNRFVLVEDGLGNLGTVGCLNELVRHAQSPWVAFCDQDDVWLPEKLERCLTALRAAVSDDETPGLAYCDLAVVDADLEPQAPSFWDLVRGRRYALGLRGLPVLNFVPGCTMLVNRALLKAAFPVPPCAPMHDWWIGMVAKYAGTAAAIDAPLMLYRQHASNQLGATALPSMWTRLRRRWGAWTNFRRQGERSRSMRIAMLDELARRRAPTLRTCDLARARQSEDGGIIRRLAFLLRSGVRPHHAFVYWLT